MKYKIWIIILSVLLVLSLGFNGIMIGRLLREHQGVYPDWFNPDNIVERGEVAPNFSVELLSGETFTLSENRGAVVVLNFWATWCGPCVDKMPGIQELHMVFEDVIFIGMNVGEETGRIQEFVEERGFTYPIGLDRNSEIHRNLYPSIGIPYTVIIDGDGLISATSDRSGLSTIEEIEAAVRAAGAR